MGSKYFTLYAVSVKGAQMLPPCVNIYMFNLSENVIDRVKVAR